MHGAVEPRTTTHAQLFPCLTHQGQMPPVCMPDACPAPPLPVPRRAEATVDELWMCEGGEIQVFHGTFDEYKARLRAKQAVGQAKAAAAPVAAK